MAWLKIAPNTRVLVTLLTGALDSRRVHWIDNRSSDCPGEGCPYCKIGNQAQVKWVTPVKVNGQEYSWEMSGVAADQLRTAFPDQEKRRGLQFNVVRTGSTKNDTRYTLLDLNGDPLQPGSTPPASAPATAATDMAQPRITLSVLTEAIGKIVQAQLAETLLTAQEVREATCQGVRDALASPGVRTDLYNLIFAAVLDASGAIGGPEDPPPFTAAPTSATANTDSAPPPPPQLGSEFPF